MRTNVKFSILVGVILTVGFAAAVLTSSNERFAGTKSVGPEVRGGHSSGAPKSVYPVGISSDVKLLIDKWRALNKACSGESHPDMGICDALDNISRELKKRGWCWGAPLGRPASDFAWHHCGEFDTDKLR